MTRSEKLSSILRLAERKEQIAARNAAQSRLKLLECENKLKELQKFRYEYARHRGLGNSVLCSSELLERQKFINQLDEGIEILKQIISSRHFDSETEKKLWVDAYKHSSSLDRLMNKFRQSELLHSERMEESALDDRSQYRFNKFNEKF